jgi:hypothetical protein
MHFTVERDGRIEDMTSPTTDVPEPVVRNSTTAMKRSRYAPRIDNGAAVATRDVVFVERVLVKTTSTPAPAEQTAPPSAGGTETEKAPEEKPAQEQPPETETKPEPEKK